MKKIKSQSQELSKKYCKHMRGNPGFCPGDCMQCIMEFMMFPGVVNVYGIKDVSNSNWQLLSKLRNGPISGTHVQKEKKISIGLCGARVETIAARNFARINGRKVQEPG